MLNFDVFFKGGWVYFRCSIDLPMDQFDPTETQCRLCYSRCWVVLALDVTFLDPDVFSKLSPLWLVGTPSRPALHGFWRFCPAQTLQWLSSACQGLILHLHSLVLSKDSRGPSESARLLELLLCRVLSPSSSNLNNHEPILCFSAQRDHCSLSGLRFPMP